jgi:hypothetical protein
VRRRDVVNEEIWPRKAQGFQGLIRVPGSKTRPAGIAMM